MRNGTSSGEALQRRLRAPAVAAAVWFLSAAVAHADEPANAGAGEQATAILSIEADSAYGEYLAGDCVICHRRSGGSDGIPPIAGLPEEHFVNALVEYRLGLRSNEVMVVRAARLNDEEIAALAAYFASQTP